MNYSNLVKQYAAALGISQSDADKYLKAFASVVLEALQSNDSVDLSGFGKFKKSLRKARMGINPKTMEKISIAESKALTFKAALAAKKSLNS